MIGLCEIASLAMQINKSKYINEGNKMYKYGDCVRILASAISVNPEINDYWFTLGQVELIAESNVSGIDKVINCLREAEQACLEENPAYFHITQAIEILLKSEKD